MSDWLGFGPSAASQFAGKRWTNVSNLEQWLQGVASRQAATEQVVELSPTLLLCDALVFGLRMNAGVEPTVLAQRFKTPLPSGMPALAHQLAENGLASWDGNRLTLTDEGRLVVDAIGVEIMEVFDL